jgi:hypothetical protein
VVPRTPSGRAADVLDVVNDALGSFLLRANEVIDQVPMSACGANTNVAAIRCCNFQNTLGQSRRNYSGGLELVEGACFEAIDPAPKSIERSLIFSSFATE